MGRQIWVRPSRRVIIARCPLIPEVTALMLSRVSWVLAQITCYPLCSPRGSTLWGRGLSYLAMVKNSSVLSWIQILIWIST